MHNGCDAGNIEVKEKRDEMERNGRTVIGLVVVAILGKRILHLQDLLADDL